jgi:HEPN domain-containing protein
MKGRYLDWLAQAENDFSCAQIAQELFINGQMLDELKEIDQFYIPTRYPDALPGGAPFQIFTENQAMRALEIANKMLNLARQEITV